MTTDPEAIPALSAFTGSEVIGPEVESAEDKVVRAGHVAPSIARPTLSPGAPTIATVTWTDPASGVVGSRMRHRALAVVDDVP
jgi:hypothetical protein